MTARLAGGGFESPALPDGGMAAAPAGTGWELSGYANLSANGSAYTAGNPPAPEGRQVLVLHGAGRASQAVEVPAAGAYRLSLRAAQRGNYQPGGYHDFAVLVDGARVAAFRSAGTAYEALEATLMLSAGAHTITLAGIDTPGAAAGRPPGQQNVSFVDDVRLAPVTARLAGEGFEAPEAGPNGSWGSFLYAPTGTAWAYAGTAGVTADGSGFTAGNPPAPDGDQVAFLQGAGRVSQAVAVPADGAYRLTFQAAQRGNWQTGGYLETGGGHDFVVEVDGVEVARFRPTGTSYQELGATLTLAAGMHTIAFRGLNTALGDNTSLLDAVSLRRVDDTTPPKLASGSPGGQMAGPVATLRVAFDEPINTATFTAGDVTIRGPVDTAWAYAGTAGVAADGSGFTAGNPAPRGEQVAFLQGAGRVSQAVAVPADGAYRLTFQAAQRYWQQTSYHDFAVEVDGVEVARFRPTGTSYQELGATLTLAAGMHTIAFRGLNTAGDDNTSFLDDVRLAPVTARLAGGGFESPALPDGGMAAAPAGTGWELSGYANLSANGSAYTAGNPPAPEGRQVLVLHGAGRASQAVEVPAAGAYRLSLRAAQRGNYQPGGYHDFAVLVDGVQVAVFRAAGTAYERFEAALQLAAGTRTITLAGIDTPGAAAGRPPGQQNVSFVDDVRLDRVEASQAALGDGGFERPVLGAGNFLYRPSGPVEVLGVKAVQGSGDRLFDVEIAAAAAAGDYAVTVGPFIVDAVGNQMAAAERFNFTINQVADATLRLDPDHGVKADGAVLFNGMGQYLTGSGSLSDEMGTSYSVQAWVSPNSTAQSTLVSHRSTSSVAPIASQLELVDGRFRFVVRDNANNIAIAQGMTAQPGRTYHLVGVREGNSIKLYVNGVMVDEATATFGTMAPNTLDIGANASGSTGRSNFANGRIQGVGVWGRRALSTADVAALYAGGSGLGYDALPAGLRTSLIRWYSLGEGDGYRADRLGGPALVPIGSPTWAAPLITDPHPIRHADQISRLVPAVGPTFDTPAGSAGRAFYSDDPREFLPSEVDTAGGPAASGPILSGRASWTWATRLAQPIGDPTDATVRPIGPIEVDADGSYHVPLLLGDGRLAVRIAGAGGTSVIDVVSYDTLYGRRTAAAASASLVDSGTRAKLVITVGAGHRFSQKDEVALSGFGAPYDGSSRVVSDVDATTITVVIDSGSAPAPTLGAVAATGRIQRLFADSAHPWDPTTTSWIQRHVGVRLVRESDVITFFVRGEAIGMATVPGGELGPSSGVTSYLFRDPLGLFTPVSGRIGPMEAWDGSLSATEARRVDVGLGVRINRTRDVGPAAVFVDGTEAPGTDRKMLADHRYEWAAYLAGTDILAISPTGNEPFGQSVARPTGTQFALTLGTGDETEVTSYDLRLTLFAPPYDIDGIVNEDKLMYSGLVATIEREPWGDSSTDIYVSASTGNDANAGTDPGAPLASIKAALQRLQPRVRIRLKRGDTFMPAAAPVLGDYGGPVALRDYGDPSLDPPKLSRQAPEQIWLANGARDVRIHGIDIAVPATGSAPAIAAPYRSNVTGILFHDITLRSQAQGHGFLLANGTNIAIHKVRFQRDGTTGAYGIFFLGETTQFSLHDIDFDWPTSESTQPLRMVNPDRPHIGHIRQNYNISSYTHFNIRHDARLANIHDVVFSQPGVSSGGGKSEWTAYHGYIMERVDAPAVANATVYGGVIRDSIFRWAGVGLTTSSSETLRLRRFRVYGTRFIGEGIRGSGASPMAGLQVAPTDGARRNVLVPAGTMDFGSLSAPAITAIAVPGGVAVAAEGPPLGGVGRVQLGYEYSADGGASWRKFSGVGATYFGEPVRPGDYLIRPYATNEDGTGRVNGAAVAVTVAE